MLLLQSLFISFQFLENKFKMQKKKRKKERKQTKFTTIVNSKLANQFNSVQSLSYVQLFVTSWTAAKHQATLPFTNSQSLLKLMSIESVMQSSSVIPSSSRLQSFPASGPFQMSQFFASGGQSIGVPTSASVLPMNIQG